MLMLIVAVPQISDALRFQALHGNLQAAATEPERHAPGPDQCGGLLRCFHRPRRQSLPYGQRLWQPHWINLNVHKCLALCRLLVYLRTYVSADGIIKCNVLG